MESRSLTLLPRALARGLNGKDGDVILQFSAGKGKRFSQERLRHLIKAKRLGLLEGSGQPVLAEKFSVATLRGTFIPIHAASR